MSFYGHIIGIAILAVGVVGAQEKKNAPRQPAQDRSLAAKPTGPRNALAPLSPKTTPPSGRNAQKNHTSPLLRSVPTPITTLDQWNRMTPEQRQRALAKLPPERRQQMQERLDRFNSLPKEEQDRLRRRYYRFSHLPPEKQFVVKRQIQAFINLPEARRPGISREFEQLRRMPVDERNARINSEEFRNRYSPREQQLLSDLAEAMAVTAQR
jgi:hypothetical protein